MLTLSSPLALLGPAKSHPEVIVQAVAARNRQKAETYAKANAIPEVKNSYQGESCKDPSLLDTHPMPFIAILLPSSWLTVRPARYHR